jgi:integrase
LNYSVKSLYLDELSKRGLGQTRKKKVALVLERINRLGFTGTDQWTVDKYFSFLQNSDMSYETKRDYWFIFSKYWKWLNPELNLNYRLQVTVKKKLPETLTLKEVVQMINMTRNSRDRAILSLLFDSGMRPGELLNLKVEDVIFDENGLLVNVPVEGKRGQRRIRIVNTVHSEEALKEWLKYHEFKSDPYCPLFYRMDRRTKTKIRIESLNKIVKDTGKKIQRNINSYTFRHSRATFLAKFMTEQEMKIYFGWTMGSDMVKVYVHMSCRDLDQKVLELNKKPVEKKEDLRQLIREELLRVLREV